MVRPIFQDDVLKQLIQTALDRNYDLRIASERVLETGPVWGQPVRICSRQPAPQPNSTRSIISEIGSFRFLPPGFNPDVSYTQAGFTLGWELDVWGRLRRLTESARAQYLASGEARRGVITTLLADVTSRYFQLRELDLELEIARKTRDTAENSLRLPRCAGIAVSLPASTSTSQRQFLYTATAQIANIERLIGQTETQSIC